MSSGYWQTRRQNEQYCNGLGITQKVEAYCGRWEDRCYPEGIPDSAVKKLLMTGRVPSYQAIASCILKNDLHLRGLGFDAEESDICRQLRGIRANADNPQARLF